MIRFMAVLAGSQFTEVEANSGSGLKYSKSNVEPTAQCPVLGSSLVRAGVVLLNVE